MGSAINFDVRVDVKVIEFTDEMAVNLFFNSVGNEQYIFGISSSRYFALHRIDTDNIARRVLKWTPISVEFNPRAWNEMRVVVDEQLIRIYLNSKLLGEYRDTNLTGGQTGIGVEMYKNGAVIVDFDNFQFRRKP